MQKFINRGYCCDSCHNYKHTFSGTDSRVLNEALIGSEALQAETLSPDRVWTVNV